jgi:hypothetical protein
MKKKIAFSRRSKYLTNCETKNMCRVCSSAKKEEKMKGFKQ